MVVTVGADHVRPGQADRLSAHSPHDPIPQIVLKTAETYFSAPNSTDRTYFHGCAPPLLPYGIACEVAGSSSPDSAIVLVA